MRSFCLRLLREFLIPWVTSLPLGSFDQFGLDVVDVVAVVQVNAVDRLEEVFELGKPHFREVVLLPEPLNQEVMHLSQSDAILAAFLQQD